LYSMPPVRFKTKPLIDIVSNMLIFGSLPFVLGWLTSGAKTSMDIFILGLIMGIPVISYTLLISWRDIKTDAEFGIKPTNVLLGYNWTIHAAIILWILLLFLCVYKFYLDVITISFLGVFPVLMILWLRHIKLKDLRQKNINFFLPISTMLWSFLVFLLLCILTCSIIPAIFLIIAILLFFKNSFKIYHSLKHISS